MYNKPINDLTGYRFGSIVVTGEFRIKQRHRKDGKLAGKRYYWKAVCDCGSVYWLSADALLKRKKEYCKNCKPEPVRNSKLYHIYHGIKQRCYNSNNPAYKNYGGRGIKMCNEWLNSYNSFKDWAIKNGYVDDAHLSVDRIDNDKDYCADNCQIISISENTSKGNFGKVKSHSSMENMYAISPDGEKIEITNIAKFSRDHDLNLSSVGASLRGYRDNEYLGWHFYSERAKV